MTLHQPNREDEERGGGDCNDSGDGKKSRIPGEAK